MLPYSQENKNNNIFVREFSPANAEMFIWHRDKKDRIVKILSSNSWMLQIDNELPIKLIEGNNYLIQKNSWHRVIAGNNILKLEITELESGQLK